MRAVILLSLAGLSSLVSADQSILNTPQTDIAHQDIHASSYQFQWAIKRVAIIGAGVSGLLAYKSLLETDHFTSIRIFERDRVPGGNWHYTTDRPSPVPILKGQQDDWWTSDYTPEHHPTERVVYEVNDTSRDWLRRKEIGFILPKPIWETLKSNTPAPQQQVSEFPWPPHVPWASHWSRVQKYLRAYAAWLGVGVGDKGDVVEYNTRVEYVDKRWEKDEDGGSRHRGWRVGLHRFERISEGRYEESWWTEDFDAVIVASGRFNVPHIPPIVGLAEWQESFPEQVYHSREYRNTSGLEGKNVIVVGGSASATGISADINTVVNTSYLSIREHSDDPRAPVRRAVHLSSVSSNTTVIPEIKAFHPTSGNISEGVIELINGTNLTGIDAIIFGTGFRYSFPYLSQYHNTSTNREEDEHPIVTDGSHLQALWYDTFYIDQPTIAFQGQLVGIQSFVYGRYAGAAIAKVWAGQASLPNTATLWKQFWETVEDRGGLRRGYQWLTAEKNRKNLLFFVNWLNGEAVEKGGEILDLPPDVSEEMALWQRARGAPVSPDGRNDFWLSGFAIQGEDWRGAVRDDW